MFGRDIKHKQAHDEQVREHILDHMDKLGRPNDIGYVQDPVSGHHTSTLRYDDRTTIINTQKYNMGGTEPYYGHNVFTTILKGPPK